MTDILKLLSSTLANIREPLTTEAVRKVLVQRGLTSIRQSALSMGRGCPAKLTLSQRQGERASAHMLLGSVWARAARDPEQARVRQADEGYYRELFAEVRAADPTPYFHRGERVDKAMVRSWCLMFSTRERIGLTLGELAWRSAEALREAGVVLEAVEEDISYREGLVTFTGVADKRGRWGSRKVLFDDKSSGLWDPYLKEDGSIKAVSFTELEVTYHQQLQHYEWLLWRSRNLEVDLYGIVTPTNLVPYLKGDKKGQPRGLPFFVAPSLGRRGRVAYEADLRKFLLSYTGPHGDYRARPHTFGKSDCPDCPYFNACQGDLRGSSQGAALDTEEFSYLHTP